VPLIRPGPGKRCRAPRAPSDSGIGGVIGPGARLVGVAGQLTTSTAEADRANTPPEYTAMAVLDQLLSAARERPIVLVIEDVHDADLSSLRLIDAVARELDNERVVLLVTCRPPSPGSVYEQWMVSLLRQSSVRELVMGALSPEAVSAYAAAVLHVTDPALVARFGELSGGNPLFLRELARWWPTRLRSIRIDCRCG
jgi:predicted ATPase